MFPALPPPGFEIREMDIDDPADVAAWLAVHNDAFDHDWGVADFEDAILGHPVVRVDATFLVTRGDEAVGTGSVGAYRRNEQVGIGHYLGVKRSARSLGLGHVICVRRLEALAERGIRFCEDQTHISRRESLWVHFDLGFHPKYRFDEWNSEDPVPAPVRGLTSARLWALHQRWRRSRPPAPASR